MSEKKYMIFTWAGYACFKIEGNSATFVLDPFDDQAGQFPKTAADIVISTKTDSYHGNTTAIQPKSAGIKIITGPGEYEVKDVLIYGMELWPENGVKSEARKAIIYKIQFEGVQIVQLGALSFSLSASQLDHFEKTDILLIPVGGGRYLGSKAATELINQIDPRVVIPMCYKVPGMKEDLSPLNDFCKEIGICPKETIKKYKIAKKDLPTDTTEVVILEKS